MNDETKQTEIHAKILRKSIGNLLEKQHCKYEIAIIKEIKSVLSVL